jgi:hypothetical protein
MGGSAIRFLFIPILYGVPSLHSNSAVNGHFDLARALTRYRPDVFCHVAIPRPGFWKYDASLYQGERVAPLFYDALMDHPQRGQLPQLYESFYLSLDVWNALNDKTKSDFAPDLIMTIRNELPVVLKNVLSYTTHIWRDVPLVVQAADMPWTLEQRDHVQRTHALNLICDWPWFLSPNDADIGRGLLRKYVAPSELQRVTERPIVLPHAVDMTRIDEVMAELGPRPARPPRAFYGGRLMGKKRVKESADLLKPLFELGEIGRYAITTNSTDSPDYGLLKARPDVEVFEPPSPREVFLRRMHQADFFHCLSTNEAAGQGYFEMQASGLVGIFQKAPWMKGLVPEDYPFLARGAAEVAQMSRWVARNLEEARRKAEDGRRTMREWYSADRVAREFYAHAERLVRLHLERNKHSGARSLLMQEMLRNGLASLGDPERVTMDELADAVRATSQIKWDLRKMRFRVGKGAVLDALRMVGWVDDCQTEEAVFVKAEPAR